MAQASQEEIAALLGGGFAHQASPNHPLQWEDVLSAGEAPPPAANAGRPTELAYPDHYNPENWAEAGSPELLKLRDACHEPLDAACLVLGLILSDAFFTRVRQIDMVSSSLETIATIRACHKAFGRVDPEYYVPLLEMAVPALKRFSPEQYRSYEKALLLLIMDDGEFTLREWILYQLVVSLVGRQFAERKSLEIPPVLRAGRASLAVLGTLAGLPRGLELPQPAGKGRETTVAKRQPLRQAEESDNYSWSRLSSNAPAPGQRREEDILRAFRAGVSCLPLAGDCELPPPATPQELSEHMDVLERCPEQYKDRFLRAAQAAALHDGVLQPEEAMLLRLFSLCLGRPVPPRNLP